MDDFVVTADKPKTKIECKYLLSINQSAELAGTELFSINKIWISNKQNSVLRCYIIDENQTQSEITNYDNIYGFDDSHRKAILKINHSKLTFYSLLEKLKIHKQIKIFLL